MITFHIKRWTNTYRSKHALPPGLSAAWDRSLLQLEQSRELASLAEREEWVLVRRLTLSTRLSADGGRADAGGAWEQALSQSLKVALEVGGPNVVRYRDRREAVADMVYRLALGDGERAWAWRQMGLIPDSSLPMHGLRGAAWGALLAEREGIWPLITRLLFAEQECGAFSALVRAMPPETWRQVLAGAWQTRRYVSANAGDDGGVAIPGMFDTPGAKALLAWARANIVLAQRNGEIAAVLLAGLGSPRGQPSGTACSPGAVLREARLALAATVPARLPALSRNRQVGADVGARAAAEDHPQAQTVLRRDADGATKEAVSPSSDDGTGSQPIAARYTNEGAGGDARRDAHDAGAEALPEPPALPDTAEWQPTDWAGLLFLLHLLPASGALSQPFVQAATPVFTWRLALALDAHEGDAALRAFCGGWQPSAPERRAPPGQWAEADALARATCALWEEWLAERAPDLDRPRLPVVCRRRGRIRFEPGWIEVHLPLDAADARLRRLALDLDLGWLPWLGTVIRICYD